MTGSAKGDSIFIPQRPIITFRLSIPIQENAISYFAITLNKSQGQTLKIAGIDVREDCFLHRQLYVACSRVSMPENLIILSP